MMNKIILYIIFCFVLGCSGSGSGGSSDKDYVKHEDTYCNLFQHNIDEYNIVEPPRDMKVFVLIGQSNAAGRGELLPEDMKVFKNIYLLFDDSNHWIKAQNPFNKFSNIKAHKWEMNMLYRFALELEANYPGQSFGFISNARGGTSIREWQKTEPCYECTMDRIILIQHEIVAVLVHQGEVDDTDPNWLGFAVEMIDDFRHDLDIDVPFIFGQLVFESHTYFNNRIWELLQMVDNVGIVSSEGLTYRDLNHFDREGQMGLGLRYFEKWNGLYNK